MTTYASRIQPKADVVEVAALLAAEVVEYTRKALAADEERDRWLALSRARDHAQILLGLTSYVAMIQGMQP